MGTSDLVGGRASDQGSRRSVRLSAAALVMSLVGLAAACGPPDPPPPDPHGLRPSLRPGEMVLEWHAPGADPIDRYELQWGTAQAPWSETVTVDGTTASLSGLENRTRYVFRVRVAGTDTSPPGQWGTPVEALYVDLVLPVVQIDTEADAPILDRKTDVDATMRIDPNGSAYEPYSGTIEIRGRGNSTWAPPKKPYRLELDEDSELMGMPIHEDWVLLANWMDRSQLRTWVAAQASEATDLPYTPRYRHVEVVLNGRYVGVYQLTEDPDKIDPNRIDITEIEGEDVAGEALTGGYLLEIDDRLEENAEPGFRTTRGVPVVVKEPDPAAPEQAEYIRTRVQSFEDALFSADFADPVEGYRAYLDLDTFIDHYLVQELTRNEDAFWSSTFFYKDRSSDRFRFGPIWDFDLSLGTAFDPTLTRPPEGFHTRGRMPWTTRIFEDPSFVEQVGQRWDELRPEFGELPSRLHALGGALQEAIHNDESLWGYTLQATDQPAYLRDYLSARIDWLDGQYGSADVGT